MERRRLAALRALALEDLAELAEARVTRGGRSSGGSALIVEPLLREQLQGDPRYERLRARTGLQKR